MYAAPYTRWHCSQWNVDQAAAFVVCSVEAAERSGVARENWVFPVGAVESNAMVPLSQRDELHRSPAVSAGGEQLAVMSGGDPRDADHFDLYSCFPSAVQVQAHELHLGSDRPFTVTGGMTFAGGPLDNYNFQALAKMVEVLRAQPGTTGLVTCISGMITKHGMAMWSTNPPADGFRFADVSDETSARTAVRDLAPDHDGPARIDGYTVVHSRTGEPERAIVIATTPDGRRAVAASTNTELAAAMLDDEWCGRDVQIAGSTFR
jgi:acetyl-CoA C-acetyltransferase